MGRKKVVVVKKRRPSDRKNLLAELKKYQLEPDQMAQLHSTSAMQTKGLKKFVNETQENLMKSEQASAPNCSVLLESSRRRRRWCGRSKRGRAATAASASSSEDTDDISLSSSSDTDCYFKSEDEKEEEEKPTIAPATTTAQLESKPNLTTPRDESASNIPIIRNDKRKSKEESTIANKVEENIIDHSKLKKPKLEPAIFVQVVRLPDIEEARLKLPIIGEEQNIMETIRYNDIVIVSGETGSGKTTQIPQFLYEAGYALNDRLIGITEPRRVAAVSMSERVAKELNLSQEEVSYQIRFAGNVTNKTKIKFMTDGVLLRECQRDFLLSKYSVIIIDEAHERSVFSDILIGLLSRIVPMRAKRENPLKLIIMSATLRVTDFTQNSFLFKQPPPLINIDARQFPVTIKFAQRTPSNYLQAAYKKVCSVHSKMPTGGILVFVTSQMDVKVLCKKLREKFPNLNVKKNLNNDSVNNKRNSLKLKRSHGSRQTNESNQIVMKNLKEDPELGCSDDEEEPLDDDLFKFGRKRTKQSDPLDWSDACSNSDEDEEDGGVLKSTKSPLFCLGLYAMLPLEKQRLVFREPPEGTRLCVVATNVAETSITIPNIRYVVDTGLEKTKVYDLVTGVSKFVTTWTSKSSAEQRKGRAGRMGPGHCYRLYSSAVFSNDFPDFAEPRILQKPVEDVLLQMKSMNIDNVVNFPFPTRPSMEALIAAEKKLILLGALDDSMAKNVSLADKRKTEFSSRPTALGRAMSCFAVSARCSKMIVLSPPDLLPHVVSLVAALTVREMFLDNANCRVNKKKWAGHGGHKLLGDFMAMLGAIYAANKFEFSPKQCLENNLRTKAMLEIDKLRRQLIHEININLKNPLDYDDVNKITKKPTETQCTILRQLLLSSYCDNVARKLPDGEIAERSADDPNKFEKKKLKHAYECANHEGPVYISSDSVLKGEHYECIIYKELYQGEKKMFMRDVAVIDPSWLPQ